jgi:hypothetical protein
LQGGEWGRCAAPFPTPIFYRPAVILRKAQHAFCAGPIRRTVLSRCPQHFVCALFLFLRTQNGHAVRLYGGFVSAQDWVLYVGLRMKDRNGVFLITLDFEFPEFESETAVFTLDFGVFLTANFIEALFY